ncbi:MAG: DUF1499 domain-containing protein [Silicimonas sp.]|nr:DUF1499 domain-containing protein [Silicimonas sp.]
MNTFLYILAFVLVAGFLWLRFSPNDPDAWHVDPGDADEITRAQVRLIGREAPRFRGDAEAVLETVLDIAMEEPRIRVLDGSVDEGMITFVAYSRVGFRDYITVKAVAEAGGLTKLSIASRTRSPVGYDWGVNADRIDRWLQELEHTFGG